ncbi:MAG: right-handed parallel beta-helix repeat-containing protein [Fuerstia sp.]|nr:right-handed parallel beta-helix repeat-containing protein [Fuerstiella sp.]
MTAASASRSVLAGDPPPVTNPRATDGDERFEPNWDERLTLSVGEKSGDMIGQTDKVIQAALDYVARLGGGTVKILPGTYTFRNAVWMPSRVRLLGSGTDSVITRLPSARTELTQDSDWYDQEVTLKDGSAFQVGDGIVFQATNTDNNGATVIKRTLVARHGNRFKLNDGLRENLWLSGKPTCATLFPLLTGEHTADVIIENITLDGNRENCENFNGNYGGCIFLQDCNRYTFRGVTARNYNGDGISFQICHDVVVENCHSHDNTDLGVHPGSGSQRPIIRGNTLERNSQGIFWCWGVKYGLAENNIIDGNTLYGVSIGHNDTDNVMRNNQIRNSGKFGILFRDENRGLDFWANRNVIENNIIENSGDDDGAGIEVTGETKDIRLVGNTIKETRGPARRIGIRIGEKVGKVDLAANQFSGVATEIVDRRAGA